MRGKSVVPITLIVLAIGGSTVYAQSTNNGVAALPTTKVVQKDTDQIMISKQDYIRMVQIIKDVNMGKSPVSALKDAQPLLDKKPEYYDLLTNYPELKNKYK